MKAIIIKELRENLKWTLLLMLALGIAMAFAMKTFDGVRNSLVSMSVHEVTCLGFAATGAFLGLLQTLQDSSVGRRAFLMHRPITRSRIFFSKVIAGLMLYLVMTGLPLLGLIFWVMTPGHIAVPFEWHMILPRLSDLFAGLTWYAAGLVVGSRRARWIGSRILPAGIALAGFIVVISDPSQFRSLFPFLADLEYFFFPFFTINLFTSSTIILVIILILLSAAWGAFIHDGEYARQSFISRFALGICLVAGISLALSAGVGFGEGILSSMFAQPQYFSSENIEFLGDGRIIRVRNGAFAGGAQTTNNITDLNGQPLKGQNATDISSQEMYMWPLSLAGPANYNRIFGRNMLPGYQDAGNYLRLLNGYSPDVNWYYLHGSRTIEGFNTQTLAYVGSLGPDGFIPPDQSPHPFPDDIRPALNQTDIIFSNTTAYEMDLNGRQVHRILVTTPQDPIFDAMQQEGFPTYVLTGTSLHIFNQHHELCSVPVEYPYPQCSTLRIGQETNGRFILDYNGAVLISPSQRADAVIEVDEKGTVTARTNVTLSTQSYSLQRHWWEDAAKILVSPRILALIEMRLVQGSISLSAILIFTVWNMFYGTAMLFLLWRYRMSRKGQIAWIGLSVLLGITGILLFLSLHQRSALVRCPSCRKRRIVTREFCEHCGAAFEKPSNPEIEIFETA